MKTYTITIGLCIASIYQINLKPNMLYYQIKFIIVTCTMLVKVGATNEYSDHVSFCLIIFLINRSVLTLL